MPQAIAMDTLSLPWTPHQTFGGVQNRFVIQGEMSARLEVRVISVAPGFEIPNHTHEFSAETFYILSGRGEFYLDGRRVPCQAGTCGYADPGKVHGVKNLGETDLQLLAVFAPPTQQATAAQKPAV